MRALEVGEITGEPFTAQLPADGPELVPHTSIGLDLPRDVLDQRIRDRVRRMFDDGLVDGGHGPARQRAAGRSHGQPGTGLSPGDRPPGRSDSNRPQAEEDIVLGTRRFARRQQRWFHRDPRTIWLDAMAPASSTASSIAALMAEPARRLDP